MAEQHRTPDVGQLGDEGLPQGDFPAGRSDFRVYFDAETHARIVAHAAEDQTVEICGILVGRWQQDANGPFVAVSACIRCDEAVKKSGEVTFTHDAWTTINREMDTHYVDLKIVGWYHSHPGFGVFLSERDTFIHEHFFSNPGQIALVVDPMQKTEGVFVWRDGEPAPCGHYWIGERICTPVAEDAAEPQRPSPSTRGDCPDFRGEVRENGTVPLGAEGDRHIFRPKMGREMGQSPAGWSLWTALAWALPLASMFLIGYLLADMKSAAQQKPAAKEAPIAKEKAAPKPAAADKSQPPTPRK